MARKALLLNSVWKHGFWPGTGKTKGGTEESQ